MAVHDGAAGSPPAAEQDTTNAETQVTATDAGGNAEDQDAKTAESSAADKQDAKQDGPTSLFDAVRSAVEPKKTEGASSNAEPELVSEEAKAAAAEAKAKAEGDDGNDVPFHNHPRWQKLNQDLRDLKKLEPAAQQYQQIEQFMTANQLSADEAVRGFQIMALIKTNPEKALEELTKIVGNIEMATGKRLPDDLKAKVDAGLVDEETAAELAQTRTVAATNGNELKAKTEREQVEEDTRVRTSMRDEVNSWEASIRSKDADYGTKQPMVHSRVRAIVQETGKSPSTKEEAVALAKRAYDEVNEHLKPLIPTRRPMSQMRSTASAAGARPQPKSLGEAVRMAAASQG